MLSTVLLFSGCGEALNDRNFMPEPQSEMVYGWEFYDPFADPEPRKSQRIDPCDTVNHLAFREASPMAKQMLRGERYDLQDDANAFAVLDSFVNSKDPSTREFYFLVMTRALPHADGYYAEGISVTNYALFDSLPCEYLSHFSDIKCLNDSDLQRWSFFFYSELFLDEDETGKLEHAQVWMTERCGSCEKRERDVAARINKEIAGWAERLRAP